MFKKPHHILNNSSSNTLSGNRTHPILNSVGKDDKNHSRVFNIDTITNHPEIRLTRGGMILIGLMSGGDYQQGGLARCGVTTAHALARCGFGDILFEAAMNLDRDALEDFLVSWREDVRNELRTNSKGEIGRKQVVLANSITEKFPDIDLLLSYIKPITSKSIGRASNDLRITWDKEPDLGKLAGVCEFYFEWGYKEAIVKRFRTIIWHSIVLRILRRAVLDLDKAKSTIHTPSTAKKNYTQDRTPCGTPSKMVATHCSVALLNSPVKVYTSDSESDVEDEGKRLIVKVHAYREHPSTDGLPEYRLEIAPQQLVRLTESGIRGTRTQEGPDEWASGVEGDEDGGGKKGRKVPDDPKSHLRVWMPACMVKLVEPQLVDNFESQQDKKRLKKAMKGTRNASSKGKAAKKRNDMEDIFPDQLGTLNARKPMTPKPTSNFLLPSLGDDTSSESEGQLDSAHKPTLQPFLPEGDPLLRRGQASNTPNSMTEGSLEGTNKHPVYNITSAEPRARLGIRDLTKAKKQTSTTTIQGGIKSFFSVSRPSNTTKTPPLQPSRDADSIVPFSPTKRKTRQGIGSPSDSDLNDCIKKSPRRRFTDKTARAQTVSPSPSKPITKTSIEIIEISSEDPDGPTLLRTREGAMTSRHSESSTKKNPQLRKGDKPSISSDIIDLT